MYSGSNVINECSSLNVLHGFNILLAECAAWIQYIDLLSLYPLPFPPRNGTRSSSRFVIGGWGLPLCIKNLDAGTKESEQYSCANNGAYVVAAQPGALMNHYFQAKNDDAQRHDYGFDSSTLKECPAGTSVKPGTGTKTIDRACTPCQEGVTFIDATNAPECKVILAYSNSHDFGIQQLILA